MGCWRCSHHDLRSIAAAALFALTGCASDSGARRSCEQAETPDLQISACTDLIQSTGEAHKDIAFINRGYAYIAKGDFDRPIQDSNEALRLTPNSPFALFNRGSGYFGKGDYDRAIHDYDTGLRLEPDDVQALKSRGDAYIAKGDYDRAIQDFDHAIRLKPKIALLYYDRSVAQMLGRRPEGAAGFRTALDLEGWKGRGAPYAVIFGNIAARQVGDEATAKQFLRDSVGKLDEGWPYPVIRFLRGEINEDDLVKQAVDDDKQAQIHCFLGLEHALAGRTEEAATHYLWVKEHSGPSSSGYWISTAELERLGRGADAGSKR